MAPRTSWKGFLKLSLVSVPVKAYTANNTSDEVRLNQLHADCHQRVRYRKVCPEHGELASDQIVSGYEFGKDQYVVIDPSEVAKLRPESDRAVRIDGFVDEDVLDARYFAGKTYYLLPDGVAGERPYALLARGMADAGKVAMAWIVLSGREQLVMLRPLDDMLVLSVLHVHAKIKGLDAFRDELEPHELADEELALTQTLIGASLVEEFDFTSYEDAYVARLKELIRLKVDGQEVGQASDPEEPRIINLMDALKRSVAQAQAAADPSDDAASGAGSKAAKAKASPRKAARKMAPSAKKKATRKGKSG